jgi:predicted nucleic acid-binding protein
LRHVVLDASVLGRWIFQPNDAVAGALQAEFEAGELTIAVPALVFLELLNVAGRQLGWAVDDLTELVDRLQKSGFDVLEPDLARVATWVARGLTAYDASYVALAEQLDMPLATGDRLILELAPRLAVPPEGLGSARLR